jgi:hypothetical protein
VADWVAELGANKRSNAEQPGQQKNAVNQTRRVGQAHFGCAGRVRAGQGRFRRAACDPRGDALEVVF